MSGLGGGVTFARLAPLRVKQAVATPVTLRFGWRQRAIPMELRITPWWRRDPELSLVELLPRAHVEPTEAYFDAGDRLLDDLLCAQSRPVQAWRKLTREPVRSTELA